MGEVAAAAFAAARALAPCRFRPSLRSTAGGKSCNGGALLIGRKRNKQAESSQSYRGCYSSNVMAILSSEGKPHPPDLATFSAKISTDVPLYEPPGECLSSPLSSILFYLHTYKIQLLPLFLQPSYIYLRAAQNHLQVSFDEYISDRPRVFRAMFPDKTRSKRLNEEEWRIQMLPLQFRFASVRPVVVMRLRCKTGGAGYPSGIPLHVTRILELQATRWELQGLEALYMPSNFTLHVQGTLYPERRGGLSRLRGQLEMSMSMVLPPLLALVPENILKGTAETVLTRLVERMKQEVNNSLLLDYGHFTREKLRADRNPNITTAAFKDDQNQHSMS